MREIKFRAWDNESKRIERVKALDWLKDLVETDNIFGQFGDFELMQFTGLKDKNGKEIYEGDILSALHFNHVTKERVPSFVFWMDSHGIFEHKWNEGNPAHPKKQFWLNEELWRVGSTLSNPIVEVIGNIYENPELLKEE